MVDAFGLSDVSTKDTGKGSKLKTGGRREHNMPNAKSDSTKVEPQKCAKGEIWNASVKKCIPAKQKDEPFLKWKMNVMQGKGKVT